MKCIHSQKKYVEGLQAGYSENTGRHEYNNIHSILYSVSFNVLVDEVYPTTKYIKFNPDGDFALTHITASIDGAGVTINDAPRIKLTDLSGNRLLSGRSYTNDPDDYVPLFETLSPGLSSLPLTHLTELELMFPAESQLGIDIKNVSTKAMNVEIVFHGYVFKKGGSQ